MIGYLGVIQAMRDLGYNVGTEEIPYGINQTAHAVANAIKDKNPSTLYLPTLIATEWEKAQTALRVVSEKEEKHERTHDWDYR